MPSVVGVGIAVCLVNPNIASDYLQDEVRLILIGKVVLLYPHVAIGMTTDPIILDQIRMVMLNEPIWLWKLA